MSPFATCRFLSSPASQPGRGTGGCGLRGQRFLVVKGAAQSLKLTQPRHISQGQTADRSREVVRCSWAVRGAVSRPLLSKAVDPSPALLSSVSAYWVSQPRHVGSVRRGCGRSRVRLTSAAVAGSVFTDSGGRHHSLTLGHFCHPTPVSHHYSIRRPGPEPPPIRFLSQRVGRPGLWEWLPSLSPHVFSVYPCGSVCQDFVFLLSNILLYGFVPFCLSVHQSMCIWVVATC